MTLRWMLAGTLVFAVGAASAEETKKKKTNPKAASGQIICNSQGCRPVQPGCRIEQKVYMGMSATFPVEVCN